MNRELWFIAVARNALEEGFRCVAARLNEVLDEKAKGLQIAADQPTADDSFRHALEAMRRALPGLRTVMAIPAYDEQVTPWTLGYVNDKGNLPLMLPVDSVSLDLMDDAIHLLRTGRETWRREHWASFIVQPVESHMEELRQILLSLTLNNLNQLECDIIATLGVGRLTGEKIAAILEEKGLGSHNSHLKQTLANMVKRGILKQHRPGYSVNVR